MTAKTVQIVWAGGKDAYHFQQCMQRYPEREVLDAVAEQLQTRFGVRSYSDAMRRAIDIVEYHRQLQEGATIGRDAHKKLKKDEGADGVFSAPFAS